MQNKFIIRVTHISRNMFRNFFNSFANSVRLIHRKRDVLRNIAPVTLGLVATTKASKDNQRKEINMSYETEALEHEFLIRQATTVNVNAATQLLTVNLVAIHDTYQRLRETLSQEICLVQQAMEWGEGTPAEHWDELVAVRGMLQDLRHNLQILVSYMEYIEKLATVSAEISYLSGNVAASTAICERIDQAHRFLSDEKGKLQELHKESLDVQKKAIINAPELEDKLEDKNQKKKS